MKIIPMTAQAGITGFESPASEYRQLSLDLDALLIEHPSASFLGTARGDSMQGVGIYDGDILIVDRHVTPSHGDVIVANYNGEFVCKLLDTYRQQLVSANPAHSPVDIKPEDTCTIEGVVTRSIRCHRSSPLLSRESCLL
ncbi:LexA family protein [Vibrio harveyi]|uniref:LexA family protein n=1 Tax=Vibrio harveyi TaxID=669 RepID=UPI000D7888B6|nr:translesion error-prone DNA polymerase V autoproteolytic subunit [Vibrio harveyi]